jgi:hypothetical protein
MYMSAVRLSICFIMTIAGTLAGCSRPEPPVPWDAPEVSQDLSDDLRREGVAQLLGTAVLGWRIDEGEPVGAPLPQPSRHPVDVRVPDPPRPRVEIVLLWARIDDHRGAAWAIVQGFRDPVSEAPWQRSLMYRSLIKPLERMRPGEDHNGTWHAFQRYSDPPTTRDLCEFADVDFLRMPVSPWRTVAGALRDEVWREVAGGPPACQFERPPKG